MPIYRGHIIKQEGEGWIITKNGERLALRLTEIMAMNWIDQHLKEQAVEHSRKQRERT